MSGALLEMHLEMRSRNDEWLERFLLNARASAGNVNLITKLCLYMPPTSLLRALQQDLTGREIILDCVVRNAATFVTTLQYTLPTAWTKQHLITS